MSKTQNKPNVILDYVADQEYPKKEHIDLGFAYDRFVKAIGYRPDNREIIYVEREDRQNKELNEFIKQNYDDIVSAFASIGLHFLYAPIRINEINTEEAYFYFHPNQTSAKLLSYDTFDSYQFDIFFSGIYKERLTSGLIYYPDTDVPELVYNSPSMTPWGKFIFFEAVPKEIRPFEDQFLGIIKCIARGTTIRLHSIQKPPFYPLPDADETFSKDVEFLMRDISEKVKKLRRIGINDYLITALFKRETTLSRVLITADFDIILPDYNNMRIDLAPLSKAVFFLFLRHPEGILFSNLPHYKYELLDIYSQLTNRMNDAKTRQSITDLTNPQCNRINEICARIKRAFISKFDEYLAQNYFITGDRGKAKRIILPRDMVEWTFEL